MTEKLRGLPGFLTIRVVDFRPELAFAYELASKRRRPAPMRPISKAAPPNRIWPMANRRGGFRSVKIMPAIPEASA